MGEFLERLIILCETDNRLTVGSALEEEGAKRAIDWLRKHGHEGHDFSTQSADDFYRHLGNTPQRLFYDEQVIKTSGGVLIYQYGDPFAEIA